VRALFTNFTNQYGDQPGGNSAMNSNMLLTLAFAIGVVAGLRALTGVMVASWAARLDWVNLDGSYLSFMGSTITAIVLSALALGEIVNDKLPKTPPRTALPSLIIRIVLGAFAAATLTMGSGGVAWVGALLGAFGAVVGTFGGYQARMRLVRALHVPDFVIALVEDAIAVGGGFFLASRFMS
jgi:uncharacterized membrane protein